jgi:hypothetical protein
MARRPGHSGTDSGGAGADIRAGLSAIYKALQFVRSIKIVLPLLLYFVFKLIVILLYAKGGPGILDSVWALFLPGRGAGGIGHYPQRFLLFPLLMNRLDIALDILVHVIAQGTTILLIASALGGRSLGLAGSFGRAMRRYWHLAGVMLVATVLILASTYLPVLPSLLGWTARNRYLVTGGGILLGLVVQAFFLYAVPFVLLNGESFLKAIGKSFAFARKRYLLALTLAAVPFVVTIPTFLLGFKAQALSLRIFPELLMHIQILGEIMKMISAYILVGGVTVIHIEEAAPAPEGTGQRSENEEEGV